MAYGNTEIKAALELGRFSFQADILRYYYGIIMTIELISFMEFWAVIITISALSLLLTIPFILCSVFPPEGGMGVQYPPRMAKKSGNICYFDQEI
jgi:hypothetical protein